MPKSNDQIQTDASRGKKILRATGLDNSSYGKTGASNINHKMDGNGTDLSHSISSGKAPTR
jgi:hypothetical protein